MPTRHELMFQLHELTSCLVSKYGIRNAADYAEQIVADALEGKREANSINKGYDVMSPRHGRVEVKFRQLPNDGRLEERCALSDAKEGGFDYLAIVIFHADFRVKGAVLVPYSEAWKYVEASPYNRISYSQACMCTGSIDITSEVSLASQR